MSILHEENISNESNKKRVQIVTEIYIFRAFDVETHGILQKTSKIVQRTFLLRRLLLLLLLTHSHASELVLHLVHGCLVRVHIHIWLLVELVKAAHLIETSHLLHLRLHKLLLLLHLCHWVHAHG